jgi:hypothetical protein
MLFHSKLNSKSKEKVNAPSLIKDIEKGIGKVSEKVSGKVSGHPQFLGVTAFTAFVNTRENEEKPPSTALINRFFFS